MSEQMEFPKTWEEYEKDYGFNDFKEIYTNNSRLIPSFRVKQWLDHLGQKPKFIAKSDGTIEQIKNCDDCLFKKEWEKIGKFLSVVLEKQTEQKPCEDCISRAEAIKISNWLVDNMDICEALKNLPSVQPKYPSDMGEVSDGYHTFNQLYHQRAVLFATIVKQNKDKAWKSYKHADGKFCFDSNGEWFIVGVDTPQGSYTYHYSKEYWDMFDCKELETSKEWDGHTEEDVTRLLTL